MPDEEFCVRSTFAFTPAEAQPLDVRHRGAHPRCLDRAFNPRQDTAETREFRGIAVRKHDGLRGTPERGRAGSSTIETGRAEEEEPAGDESSEASPEGGSGRRGDVYGIGRRRGRAGRYRTCEAGNGRQPDID